MRIEYALGQRACLKEGKGQQNRVACCAPDRTVYAAGSRDRLHQHRIDGNADEDQKALESQREQGAQVVLTHCAPFPVCHR